MHVKAAESYNDNFSTSFTIYPTDNIESIYGQSTMTINNGIGSGSGAVSTRGAYKYYDYHFKIPFCLKKTWNGGSNDSNVLYRCLIRPTSGYSSSVGTISNLGVYTSSGDLLFTGWQSYEGCIKFYKGSELHQVIDGVDYGLNYPFYVEFDWSYKESVDAYGFNSGATVTFNFNSFQMYIQSASASEIESYKTETNDKTTQQKLDTQISQEQTAQTTRTGILNQITSFFGSFFENIINALKSLFIPEDGYFTTWFTRLNTLLSAKLGMLYAPFDLVISVLTALSSASTSEAGIPFPELAWDGQVIIPAQTFYFSSLGSSFNDLRDAVYFGTDVVLLFAFLVLLQRKINLVMRGSEEG